MKDFVEKLDRVLLSGNASEDFYKIYQGEFKEWLDKILPEVELCQKQGQNNPWHKYGVLDHILHSVDEMKKQTTNLPDEDKRLLAYTMFYHDMGKPACHIVREKDGNMIDSFFDHNIESEKIVARTALNFNFTDKEIAVLRQLVLKHDIFMNLRTYPTNVPYLRQLNFSVVKDEIGDLNQVGDGIKLTKYLVMVGRSDNGAQNEKMTDGSFKLLDNFEYILNKIAQTRGYDNEPEME